MAYYFFFLLLVSSFKHHHEHHQCANSLTSRFLANLRKEKITCSNSVQTSAILSTLPTVVNIRNGKALQKKALICFSLLPSLASQGRSPTTLSLLSLSFVIITEVTKEGGHRRQEARGRRWSQRISLNFAVPDSLGMVSAVPLHAKHLVTYGAHTKTCYILSLNAGCRKSLR